MRRIDVIVVVGVCLLMSLGACSGPPQEEGCQSDDDCALDRICRSGQCTDPNWGFGEDAGDITESDDTSRDTFERADAADTSSHDPPDADSKEFCLKVPRARGLDFGTVDVGKSETKSITLENCSSTRPVDIGWATITAGDKNVFRVRQSGVIKPQTSMDVDVTFAPARAKTYAAQLTIATDVPGKSKVVFKLTGNGQKDEKCPTPEIRVSDGSGKTSKKSLTTRPLRTLRLDASESTAAQGHIDSYRWSVVEKPKLSTTRLTPSKSVEKPKLLLDLAGTYKIALEVTDNKGTTSCAPARAEVTALPQEDVYVELVWRTPTDMNPHDSRGADLDLHYLSPKATSWEKAPYDIFWKNKTGDWGQQNVSADNPTMLVDDTDGLGPESISHNNPVSGNNYTIGVYYYDDHGFGRSNATVRIHIDGKLTKVLGPQKLERSFYFWKVGLIEWPSKNIYKRDQIYSNGFPNTGR